MKDRRIRRLTIAVGLLVLASLMLAGPVLAADIRSKDVIVIDQDVDDDLYLFAGSITVNATVHGDLIATGGEIIINGTVEGDLWAAGGKIYVNGTVGDDVRIAGSDLQVGSNGTVGDDVLAAGFGFAAQPNSTLGSDVLVAGYQALLDGDVGGNVKGALGAFEVSGHIAGDVQVEVAEPDPEFEQFSVFMRMWSPYMPTQIIGPGLHIEDTAQIDGELTYTSPVTAQIPEGAVGGPVVYQTPVPEEEEAPQPEVPEIPAGALTAAVILGQFVRWILGMVRNFLTLLVIGVLILWLIPKWLKEVVEHWKEKPVLSLGWGAAALFAFFVAVPTLFMVMIVLDVVVGLATIGGLVFPITGTIMVLEGALIVGFSIISVYVTKVAFAYLVGRLILSRAGSTWVERAMGIIPLLIGLAIFAVVRSIPFLGGLFSFLVTLFGLGAIWMLAWVRIYKPKEKASA
jgi:hypothetical protein